MSERRLSPNMERLAHLAEIGVALLAGLAPVNFTTQKCEAEPSVIIMTSACRSPEMVGNLYLHTLTSSKGCALGLRVRKFKRPSSKLLQHVRPCEESGVLHMPECEFSQSRGNAPKQRVKTQMTQDSHFL